MNDLINWLVPFLTLLGHIGLGAFAVFYLLTRFIPRARVFKDRFIWPLIRAYGQPAAFFIALGGTVGSLYYSEVMQFAPCSLCWYQRIFLYPIVFIVGLDLWRNERRANDHVILLAAAGAILAAYHTVLQAIPTALPSCTTNAFAVSCAEKYVEAYGYITFPVMALTAFIMIIIAAGISRDKR